MPESSWQTRPFLERHIPCPRGTSFIFGGLGINLHIFREFNRRPIVFGGKSSEFGTCFFHLLTSLAGGRSPALLRYLLNSQRHLGNLAGMFRALRTLAMSSLRSSFLLMSFSASRRHDLQVDVWNTLGEGILHGAEHLPEELQQWEHEAQ